MIGAFDEIAGFHMDNFVSEKLKTLIQESTCEMKRQSKDISNKTVNDSKVKTETRLSNPTRFSHNLALNISNNIK